VAAGCAADRSAVMKKTAAAAAQDKRNGTASNHDIHGAFAV
jgi:hypothetical protein